jgi:Xaa-Pro aminopeptidase
VHELDEKLERMVRLCRAHRLGGLLLTTQPNFAWITGGRSNRIDGSREPGNGAIFLSANGRRFVIANTIEMPRLLDEALEGIPCEPVEFPWTQGLSEPESLVQLARSVSSTALPVGADWPLAGAKVLDGAIVEARAQLTDSEIERYRQLGRDVGEVIGDTCRMIELGMKEADIAALASHGVERVGARATVVLCAADERIARYRHPPPGAQRWQRELMLVVCAERHGLVVALTRLVSAGPATPQLRDRTIASASVFGRLLDATRSGATGSALFAEAARAYAAVGFPGEENRHHQGGAIGYQARDWLAHPSSDARVKEPQAFAWNPSITGTKVEDTALIVDGTIDIISGSPNWPSHEIEVRGHVLKAPLVLERS